MYNILATHRTPKQRQRKSFHFQCSQHGIFLKFKKRNVSTRKAWMSELERNTLAYLWRYGLFLKFSQSDEWFNNNIAISTFLHSTAVVLPSSYSDRYLITIMQAALRCHLIAFLCTTQISREGSSGQSQGFWRKSK